MRIKKVSQTTPVQAQIVDGYSTSTTDGYSANYINALTFNNIIEKTFSGITNNNGFLSTNLPYNAKILYARLNGTISGKYGAIVFPYYNASSSAITFQLRHWDFSTINGLNVSVTVGYIV